MAAAAASPVEKVKFNVIWEGPKGDSDFTVEKVELVFGKGAFTVPIPTDLDVSSRKQLEICSIDGKKGQIVTITQSQLEKMKLQATAIRQGESTTSEIRLQPHGTVVAGQVHNLVFKFYNPNLKAHFETQEETETRRQSEQTDYLRRVHEMGTRLGKIDKSTSDLAQRAKDLSESSANPESDAYAHLMQEVSKATQAMHPAIQIPDVKPSQSSADLQQLPVAELKKLFDETFLQNNKYVRDRLKAALQGNIQEANKLTKLEHENSQLIIRINKAIKEKTGEAPQIPNNEEMRTLSEEITKLNQKSVDMISKQCTQQ